MGAGLGEEEGEGAGVAAAGLVVAGATHSPFTQIRSPLHCASYWQPLVGAAAAWFGAAGAAAAAAGAVPLSSPTASLQFTCSVYLPVDTAVQKNLLPWHSAVQVRLPQPLVSSVMTMSCSAQPICPEDADFRLTQPTEAIANAANKKEPPSLPERATMAAV